MKNIMKYLAKSVRRNRRRKLKGWATTVRAGCVVSVISRRRHASCRRSGSILPAAAADVVLSASIAYRDRSNGQTDMISLPGIVCGALTENGESRAVTLSRENNGMQLITRR